MRKLFYLSRSLSNEQKKKNHCKKSLLARSSTHCGAAKEKKSLERVALVKPLADDKHLLCKNTPHKYKWNVVDVLLRNWSSFTSAMPVIVVNQLLVSVMIFFSALAANLNWCKRAALTLSSRSDEVFVFSSSLIIVARVILVQRFRTFYFVRGKFHRRLGEKQILLKIARNETSKNLST